MKTVKTNAMRMLERMGIVYQVHYYEHQDGVIDGVSVAQKLGQPAEQVFKTLVTIGHSKNYFVFVIPVAEELDLKKAAKSVGEKSVEMIAVKEMNQVTGYIRGGCSPIEMKKQYRTAVHQSALNLSKMMVSGGKIGVQMELAPQDLISAINAVTADLVKSVAGDGK